jgi:hypothetical protein
MTFILPVGAHCVGSSSSSSSLLDTRLSPGNDPHAIHPVDQRQLRTNLYWQVTATLLILALPTVPLASIIVQV